MGATGAHEQTPTRPAWWRRALTWTFPRPYSRGTKAWTVITLAYVVSVVLCAALEVNWLINFDEEANGSPIPIATLLWTAPTGWIPLALALAFGGTSESGDADYDEATGNGALILLWSAMALGGWIQAWAIWRFGIGVDRWSRRQRAPIPVTEPASS